MWVANMPDAKKYLDIDGLTEYHESAGHSADIADGSITTAKLANGAVSWVKLSASSVGETNLKINAVTTDKINSDAVTTDKLADGAVAWDKIDSSVIHAIRDVCLIAADIQTDSALSALGFQHCRHSPKDMLESGHFEDSTIRLCWISNGVMEAAHVNFYGNLQTRAIELYARGYSSTAFGILGVDDSWTITTSN